MLRSEVIDVAQRWIAYQFSTREQPGDVSNPDWAAANLLMTLVYDDPLIVLQICVEVTHKSDDPWILGMLGASPLEDLLEIHGSTVLPEFREAAKANDGFLKALSSVWPCTNKEVWKAFLLILDELRPPP